jgi:uncharacterized protein with HEPN domain
MSVDDAAWLVDMVIACNKIERFVRGVDGTAFLSDELRQEAVLRQLTILGEAAKNISSEFRAVHPEIPWQDMARFRDLVVHRYRRLQLAKVWEIVTEDVAALKRHLAPLVPTQD